MGSRGNRIPRRSGSAGKAPLPLGALQSPADRGLHFLPGEQTARPDPYPPSHEDDLGNPGDLEQSREGWIGSGHLRALGHDPGPFVGNLERSWRRLAGEGSGSPPRCLDGPRYPIPRRPGIATGAQVQPRPVPMEVDGADPVHREHGAEPFGWACWWALLDRGAGQLDRRVDTDHPGVGRSFQSPPHGRPNLLAGHPVVMGPRAEASSANEMEGRPAVPYRSRSRTSLIQP